jgi:hypothetical protein
MKSVAEWLRGLPLPAAAPASSSPKSPADRGAAPAEGDAPDYAFPGGHALGGELPLGHLHVWGGPPSAGKTAVLLGLLHDAARRGRETALATYDLPAQTLALRLLAMTSGVAVDDLAAGRVSSEKAAGVARARARLEALPLRILEARGCGVAVVRPSAQSAAGALHDLAALAARRHAAVVVVSRGLLPASPDAGLPDGGLAGEEGMDPAIAREADRVGWVAPAGPATNAEARLLSNRHGVRHAVPLRYDVPTGRWLPGSEGLAGSERPPAP